MTRLGALLLLDGVAVALALLVRSRRRRRSPAGHPSHRTAAVLVGLSLVMGFWVGLNFWDASSKPALVRFAVTAVGAMALFTWIVSDDADRVIAVLGAGVASLASWSFLGPSVANTSVPTRVVSFVVFLAATALGTWQAQRARRGRSDDARARLLRPIMLAYVLAAPALTVWLLPE